MEFSYFLPVNIQFGWNKVDNIADFAAPYGKKALIVTGRNVRKVGGLFLYPFSKKEVNQNGKTEKP